MPTSVFVTTEANRASLTFERKAGSLNESHLDFIKHLETLGKAYSHVLSEYEINFSSTAIATKSQLALMLEARAHIENAIEALNRGV